MLLELSCQLSFPGTPKGTK